MGQGSDEGQLLLHPVTVRAYWIPQDLRETEDPCQLAYALDADILWHPVQVAHEVQIPHARYVVVELRIVGKEGRNGLASHGIVGYRRSEDLNGPSVERREPGHRPEGRGLPGPVASDEAVYLSGHHSHGETGYRSLPALVYLR